MKADKQGINKGSYKTISILLKLTTNPITELKDNKVQRTFKATDGDKIYNCYTEILQTNFRVGRLFLGEGKLKCNGKRLEIKTARFFV